MVTLSQADASVVVPGVCPAVVYKRFDMTFVGENWRVLMFLIVTIFDCRLARKTPRRVCSRKVKCNPPLFEAS